MEAPRRHLAWLLLAALVPVALAQTASTGDKWRVTMTMQATGMSIPARTTDVCTKPGDRNAVPVSSDKSCEVYDVTRSGNTQRFKMRCTGERKMEGSGEFTYSGDHYQGQINATSGGTAMSMTYSGDKLGSCDGSEANSQQKVDSVKRVVAAQQAQAQQGLLQACQSGVQSASSPYMFYDAYHTGTVPCPDPAQKQAYCASFQGSYQAFMDQAQTEAASNGRTTPGSTPLTDSATLCGVQVAAVRQKLCTQAEGAGQTDFLGSQCPAELKTVVQRECAGRDYTSTSPQYRSFCAKYALGAVGSGSTPAAAQPAASQPQNKAQEAIDKGRKALKGLFGR